VRSNASRSAQRSKEHQPQAVVRIDRDAVLEAPSSARERATCSRLRRRSSSRVSRRAWMEPVTMTMQLVYAPPLSGRQGTCDHRQGLERMWRADMQARWRG
jgi:hypothetical protein